MSHSPTTRDDLRRCIGEPDFSRGADYFRRHMVVSADLDDDRRHAAGTVRGSGQPSYKQDIRLEWRKDGGLLRIRGACTCPVGTNCKHVAAVMLALLSKLNESASGAVATTGAPADPDVTGYLGGWLARLGELSVPSQPPEKKPATEQLFYLLGPTPTGALEIELMRVRILKDGGLSKKSQRYSLGSNIPTAAFLDLADIGILGRLLHLQRRGSGSGTGLRIQASDIPDDSLTRLVREIIATGRARAFTLQHPALTWSEPRRIRFVWQERDDNTQKLVATDSDGRELGVLPLIPPLFVDPRDGCCGELVSEAPPRVAHALVTMPPVPPKAARQIGKALGRLGTRTPLPRHIELSVRDDVRPTPVLRLFAMEGRLSLPRLYSYYRDQYGGPEPVVVPVLRLGFDYDGHLVGFHNDDDPDYRIEDKLVTIRRDRTFEQAVLSRLGDDLENLGITEIGEIERELYSLKQTRPRDFMLEVASEQQPEPEIQYLAFELSRDMLPSLEAEGWRIVVEESWPYRFHHGPLNFRAGVDQNRIDWFAFSLTASAGDQEADLLPVVLSIISILPLDSHGELPEGVVLEDLLEEMVLFLELPDGRRAPVEGSQLASLVRACLGAYTLLNGFHPGEAGQAKGLAEALEGSGVRWQGGEALLELGRKLQALTVMQEVQPPPSLKAELRHYQKVGYGWLSALRETGFGGVLADDMGLGKTVQALALLCQRHIEESVDRPSLLVIPTSLISNWTREASRFAPDLKLLVLHGPDRRQKFESIPGHHLVITTYPLLHRDHEALAEHPYELVILDEAQAVKNPASAGAKLIRNLKACQRLALTGTPIENNLEELWSLYDWVVPGLLGNRKTFRSTFRSPIEQGGNAAAQQVLATRIRPFLLRRTKEDVATDLPPKTEIDEIITLNGKQRDLYESVRVAMDQRVREAIASRGLNATQITVLDALLKMRQACCDPALVNLDVARKVKESAKRERLLEMLDELLLEGRKVLIFSQFVEMLRLIEKDLQSRKLDYAMLTGQTKKRAEQIERFQSGEVPVFLISLKAGGVGLNLTAADTVIIYDPWWNPAVERQAMDRTHRIGQDKPVFVYKLIAEGSVEAAIRELQVRKQALADSLFEGAQGGGIGLDEADIQALFAPLS
ncbi:MAG: DEAD/DEAH box helicase family protein [Geminicoccaceae bacterium]|nr:DEAD/DEAH box helicase family protein [Geminicoccaceae bacterium]